MQYPVRNFPRGIYKEQQLMKESRYKIKEMEMEKKMEEIDSRHAGRKHFEEFKEGERAYAKFTQETGAVD